MYDWQGPYGHRDENTDPKLPPLMVFFSEDAVKNEQASRLGPAVYDTVTYIKVVAAGQKQSFPIHEVKRVREDGSVKYDEAVRYRFRKVVEEWEAKQQPAMSGTPLEQWPLMDRAIVAAMKDGNVYTVQQLAALPDGALGNIRGKAMEWRAKAKAWLEDASNGAVATELRAENEKLRAEMETMQKQIAALLANQNGVTAGFDKRQKKNGKRVPADGDDIQVALPAEAEPETAGERI